MNLRGLRPIVVVMPWSRPRAGLPYVLPNTPLDSEAAWPYISLAVADRTKLGLPADFAWLCMFSTVAGFLPLIVSLMKLSSRSKNTLPLDSSKASHLVRLISRRREAMYSR